MKLTLRPTLDYDLSQLADILNQSFADYMVEIRLDAASLARLVRQESVDLATSCVVLQDEEVAGLALIGRRGWTSRLAAMAVMPDRRGQGVGRWLMAQLFAQVKAREERAMVLEVIEQNVPAVQLYRDAGFRHQRRLVGYTAEKPKGVADANLQEVDVSEVARILIRHGLPDLPWQVSGETLAHTGLPTRGYCLGPAYAATSDPTQAHISLRALVVPPKAEHQGWNRRLLQALFALHPGKTWKVPILYPEELAHGLFEGLGFEREPLTQLQMRLEISELEVRD